MSDADQKEQTNLYDYFRMQFGNLKPPADLAEELKKIPINSTFGKTCKRSIDAAEVLLTTFSNTSHDAAIVLLVAHNLGERIKEENK